jgi:sugar/nucleoside kinase (ribokinase family)
MSDHPIEPSAKRATIRDVARLAGVSIGTVSHVLNASKAVSEEARRAVNQAVAALNYRPNSLARSLIARRPAAVEAVHADLPRLVSVGYISIDFMVLLSTVPQPGERVTSQAIRKMLGGPAANVAAFAAAPNDAPPIAVEMVTQLGQDADSLWALEELVARGVDPSGVLQSGRDRLSRCIVMVEEGGRRTIVNEPFEVPAAALVEHLARRPVGPMPVCVHFDGFHAGIAAQVAPALWQAGYRLSMHAAGLAGDRRTPEGLRDLMATFDLVMLDRETLAEMTRDAPDLRNDPTCAFNLVAMPRCGHLLVTEGAGGATLRRPGAAPVHCPAATTRVVDATGAGDAFAGLFLARWLAGGDAEDALAHAVHGASRSVTALGAQGVLASRDIPQRARA